ncbi:MAG: pentapeptide repeat-containing protein, partial [Blautia sp.]|nr:pentapeptide repeat-containing protein [Blautia sp.]
KAVGADFYGSRINHVTFSECNFKETGFGTAHISFVKMQDADFTEAEFDTCRFVNLWVDNVCFRKVNFFRTSLKDIDFSTCDIEEISISDTMEELKGVKVHLAQAVSLAKRLGIVIKETENPV